MPKFEHLVADWDESCKAEDDIATAMELLQRIRDYLWSSPSLRGTEEAALILQTAGALEAQFHRYDTDPDGDASQAFRAALEAFL